MKDTSYYFSHDYNTRQDIKIKKLLVKHGMIGYGCFWSIIEDLYNNANALPLDYESIAYDLRVSENVIDSIINDFDLFIIEGNEFGSKSVEKRLEDRNEKSTKARQSALKRWGNKNNNANALQSESEPNAIKERKGKEIKEIKENYLLQKEKSFKLWILEDFQNDIKKYQNETSLDRNDLLAFYDYWRELTSNGKMKFQIEKTWQTDLRLKKWERGKNNFSKDVKKDNVKDMKSAALQAIFNNQ
jgi:uncharacterized protein YdaU (DUF1376 family)